MQPNHHNEMNNEKDFADIVETIKDILSIEIDGNIYDFHVADELGISPKTIAVKKSRNSIPYREILDFVKRRKLSFEDLFYTSNRRYF